MKKNKLLRAIALLTVGAALTGSVFFGACNDTEDNKKPADGTQTENPGGTTNPGGTENPGDKPGTTPGDTTDPGDKDPDGDDDDTPAPVEPFDGKIYLVGDSTVCSFKDTYYMPRFGYGTQIYNYFELTDNANVVNLALSGRSSLSYLTESNYTTLKTSISAGDYLIIGFGHNDEKSGDTARYTDPAADYRTESTAKGPSFQHTLYENYVKLAKDAGATPILCTPIVRYNASGTYTGSSVHVTDDGDYAQAIKALGTATDTTVIDLTAITAADYKTLGTEAAKYHAYTSYDGVKPNETPAGLDGTHLNYYGAKTVAYEFATALKETSCTLKKYVKNGIEKPGADDYAAAIDNEFTKPDYVPFDPANTTATALGTVAGQQWFATALGDITDAKNFDVSQSDGVFTVGNYSAGKVYGKFGSTYGFGAAFMRVDLSQNFTASATVKVTGMLDTVTNQSGFGMMIRDDIYINKADKSITTDFAMAGVMHLKGAIFSYTNNGIVNPKSSNAMTVAVDKTYTVTVTRTDNNYTLTVSDGEKTYTQAYPDLKVNVVDNNYAYLCLCAARGIEAQYSNVAFEYTGEAKEA